MGHFETKIAVLKMSKKAYCTRAIEGYFPLVAAPWDIMLKDHFYEFLCESQRDTK